MQNLLPQPKLKPGNLIRTKKSPHSLDQPDGSGYFYCFREQEPYSLDEPEGGGYFYCFCEQDGMTHPIKHGSVGIVINMSRVSSIGNKIVDILFNGSEKIVSIAYYDDQHGNPLWCDILQ